MTILKIFGAAVLGTAILWIAGGITELILLIKERRDDDMP